MNREGGLEECGLYVRERCMNVRVYNKCVCFGYSSNTHVRAHTHTHALTHTRLSPKDTREATYSALIWIMPI